MGKMEINKHFDTTYQQEILNSVIIINILTLRVNFPSEGMPLAEETLIGKPVFK